LEDARKERDKMNFKRFYQTAVAGTLGALALSSTGCGSPNPLDKLMTKEIEEHHVKTWAENGRRMINISYSNKTDRPRSKVYLFAEDWPVDGRRGFAHISLGKVPNGDNLEKYANLETLERLYQEVRETGRIGEE
jgi:hypothetical protein